MPFAGKYKEILNSDDKKYGGEGRVNAAVKASVPKECDGRDHSIRIRQAPLSVSIFSCTPYTEEELTAFRRTAEEKAQKKAAAKAVRTAGGRRTKPDTAGKRSLKEELKARVDQADAAISSRGEKERPLKVTGKRTKGKKQG